MQISLDRSLALIGVVVGLAGAAIALFQYYKMLQVSRVVADWGNDILVRLRVARAHAADLGGRIKTMTPVQWPHAQGEIVHALSGNTDELTQLAQSMHTYLSNVAHNRKAVVQVAENGLTTRSS
jgi:hypothetical protein